jgi:hypothetical protein
MMLLLDVNGVLWLWLFYLGLQRLSDLASSGSKSLQPHQILHC